MGPIWAVLGLGEGGMQNFKSLNSSYSNKEYTHGWDDYKSTLLNYAECNLYAATNMYIYIITK